MLEYIKVSDMVSGFQKLVATHLGEAGMLCFCFAFATIPAPYQPGELQNKNQVWIQSHICGC